MVQVSRPGGITHSPPATILNREELRVLCFNVVGRALFGVEQKRWPSVFIIFILHIHFVCCFPVLVLYWTLFTSASVCLPQDRCPHPYVDVA